MAKKPQNKAYPKELVTLGDHIRKRRLDLWPPQKESGRILGVDTATLTKCEKNCCEPKLHFILKLVKFLEQSSFPAEPKRTISD
jgi:predicted transcriptional regulator